HDVAAFVVDRNDDVELWRHAIGGRDCGPAPLSSPRKRGPITTGSGIWVPAFAGTTRGKIESLPPRISAFRAWGEHATAHPFHDAKAEQRGVDEVVDWQRELRAPRRHVAIGEAGKIVRGDRKARALEHGGDLAGEHGPLVLGHAHGAVERRGAVAVEPHER